MLLIVRGSGQNGVFSGKGLFQSVSSSSGVCGGGGGGGGTRSRSRVVGPTGGEDEPGDNTLIDSYRDESDVGR